MTRVLGIISVLLILSGCSTEVTFVVEDFKPFVNFQSSDTLRLEMNLNEVVQEGIVVPLNDGQDHFKFSFSISNKGNQEQAYYYKLYYQNESYKFPELEGFGRYNLKSAKNFYGSWESAEEGFRSTQVITNNGVAIEIQDEFRIQGNPRDEEIYFGASDEALVITEEQIEKQKNAAASTPEWMAEIRKKAELNSIPVEEQLLRDAIFSIRDGQKQGNTNNRWKRNPRAGNYQFMLVVCTEEGLKSIPSSIQNISQKDEEIGDFYNPFAYFQSQNEDGVFVSSSNQILNLKAVLNGNKGIYVDKYEASIFLADSLIDLDDCGTGPELRKSAHFEQYFHHIDRHFNLSNIPVTYDVTGDNYTKDDFQKNKEKYNESIRIMDFVQNAEIPCRTASFDEEEQAIKLVNPGNRDLEIPKKQHVGVNTRIGFSYGKFTAKIKFPEMLSNDGVWNGLTCAFWLLYQDDSNWNNRDICDNGGYIDKIHMGETDERIKSTSYSEIDIEIVKTGKHWPISSYLDADEYPLDHPEDNRNLIVACTNWDLACRDPENFSTGAVNVSYGDMLMEHHRWNTWYKALSSKYENPHDETVGRVMLYQIDWQPERIIWRIGPDKEHLKVIGYMDNTQTKIPDNQMQAVVTQEWHDHSWWPMAPYGQNDVPFPLNDIQSWIYEIEVE